MKNIIPLLLALVLSVTAVPVNQDRALSFSNHHVYNNNHIETNRDSNSSEGNITDRIPVLVKRHGNEARAISLDEQENNGDQRSVHLQKRQYIFHPLSGPLNPLQLQQDTQQIRASIAGLGTDEKTLIHIFANRTPDQMKQISAAWHKSYNSDIERAIVRDTSGHFEDVLISLLWTKYEFEAKWLHWAMHGPGTDDASLIEILLLKSNRELEAIQYTYYQLYGKPLLDRIREDVSGNFEDFFVSLLKGRDNIGAFNLESDVEALYRAGPGRAGTDEQTYIHIITNRPVQYLRHVFTRYFQKYGKTIEHHIRDEFSFNIRKALLRTVRSIHDPIGYIADEFEDAMMGLGTRDKKLIRLLVRHFRINRYHGLDYRALVAASYKAKYKRDLRDRIVSDTKLAYEKDFHRALLAIYDAW